MRAAVTSLSFVPPNPHESISQFVVKEPVSSSTTVVLPVTCTRPHQPSSLSRTTSLDAFSPQPEEPSKLPSVPFDTTKNIPKPLELSASPLTTLLRKAESYLEDEDPSGPLMSPVISHQRRRNPFLGTAPSESGSPLLRTKTLRSELGSEFGDDWKENVEQELFGVDDGVGTGGDEASIDTYDDVQRGNEEQHQELVVNDGSMDAMNALAYALDPMRVGDCRASDEHILPLGCLRTAPPETFYLLEKAVAARPAVWIDSREAGRGGRERNLLVNGPGDRAKLPSARVRGATCNL